MLYSLPLGIRVIFPLGYCLNLIIEVDHGNRFNTSFQKSFTCYSSSNCIRVRQIFPWFHFVKHGEDNWKTDLKIKVPVSPTSDIQNLLVMEFQFHWIPNSNRATSRWKQASCKRNLETRNQSQWNTVQDESMRHIRLRCSNRSDPPPRKYSSIRLCGATTCFLSVDSGSFVTGSIVLNSPLRFASQLCSWLLSFIGHWFLCYH